MTTAVPPPVARGHHVPEAVYVLGAVVTVLAANAAVMALWWTERAQGNGLAYLAGTVAVATLLVVGALTLRHPVARHGAIGVLAMSLVVDAVLIGYQLSGTTLLGAL